jgi:CheY-like chemotaxis protein
MDKKKILLVDDENSFLELMKLRLESCGYDIIVAGDGEEAFIKLKEAPDLIILDVMMPRLDGYSFVRKLRSDPAAKAIPVVIMTAKPDMKDLFQMEGINHYLVKPVEKEELLRVIRGIIG